MREPLIGPVPFKTPVDYWVEALDRKEENISRFHEIFPTLDWRNYDCDLHIYPYIHAVPAMISMGCPNRCWFCPTNEEHKGEVRRGDYRKILPHYAGQRVHWMDENFFANNKEDLPEILSLCEHHEIEWLAMSDYESTVEVAKEFSDYHLYKCGLRCVEIGLENVALEMKCGTELDGLLHRVVVYYLNLSFLPGETKETLRINGDWMKVMNRSLKNPIHFNNGTWYSLGQFYHTYGKPRDDGIYLDCPSARTRPSYVPDTLLDKNFKIYDVEKVNYYCQLQYSFKIYPQEVEGLVRNFMTDWQRAIWMGIGLRIGAIG